MERVSGTSLTGVSATTLWTLHNRAVEAARPDGVLDDPMAVELLAAIDHPFREYFGPPDLSHPLRALVVDAQIRAFLGDHPGGVVVSLGEGLQTTYWRLGRPPRYVAVDLPPVIALRERLLPAEPGLRHVAVSALDLSWAEAVEGAEAVMVVAEGLLMYLDPGDARALIADCAARFPGGRMLFDSIPPWFSAKTMRGFALTPAYTAPPMPFGLRPSQARALPAEIPGIAAVTDLLWPPGRGIYAVLPWVSRLPLLGDHRPSNTLLTFDGRGTHR